MATSIEPAPPGPEEGKSPGLEFRHQSLQIGVVRQDSGELFCIAKRRLPVARLAPARARAEAAYQQWKLDQAKSSLDAVADSEASLASLGRRPTGASQSLGRRWQDLEAEANRGQLDQGALDDLTVEAEELAVYRNAQVVIAQCQQLEQILGELDGDEEVRIELRGAAHFTQSQLEKFGKRRRDDVSHRRAAIEALRRDLGAWFGGRDFVELLGGLDADGRDHEGRAVAKIRSAQTRQTIKAIVKRKAGVDGRPPEALATELIAHCRERMSHVKAPRTIDFEQQLPRMENGKLLRRLLKERYRSGPGPSPEPT